MKDGIHPNYREICFVDLSNGFKFVTRSCANTKETVKMDDGRELPLYKLDTSNLKPWQPDADNLEASLLDAVSNIVHGRSEEDLLVELLDLSIYGRMAQAATARAKAAQHQRDLKLSDNAFCAQYLKFVGSPKTWADRLKAGAASGSFAEMNLDKWIGQLSVLVREIDGQVVGDAVVEDAGAGTDLVNVALAAAVSYGALIGPAADGGRASVTVPPCRSFP